ncbi:flagellar basal body-associated FliL family protein [Clostridium sp.]|uniref:flagellar basal body-associated FliL family protein n=1 Tax=Clostridium sp. TaxID=1506 RepID=UPI00321767AB
MSKKNSNGNELEKEKGGSSKLVLIIVTAIVIFALITGAVFVGYTVATKQAGKNNSGASESNLLEKEATLDLKEFLVNLSDEEKSKFVKVNIFLGSDGKNKKLQKELTAKVPQIRDCINKILRTKKSTDFTTEGEVLLKEEIIVKANELLNNGKIANVYFTDLIVQ